jgi:hypothetical protein
MVSANGKGNALEMAVRAIEATILRALPNYSEKTFRIESKKIINVGGVRHEIDIWVSVELGSGYDALFIFECKNWQEKVGKNEIIVFSEKISAIRAQKGFSWPVPSPAMQKLKQRRISGFSSFVLQTCH